MKTQMKKIPVELIRVIKSSNKTDIVFDFDQTIAKILIDWDEWEVLMGELMKKFDPGWVSLGDGIHHRLNEYIKKYGSDFCQEVVKITSEFELKNNKGFILNTELVDLVRQVDKRMYLFTSNTRELVIPYLKKEGLFDLFGKIIARNDVLYAKPDPEGLGLIYNSRIQKRNYVFIGDSKNDLAAALAFGIDHFYTPKFC